MRYAVKEGKIFEFKGLIGKILKTKEIGLSRSFSLRCRPYRYGAVGGVLSQRLIRELRQGSEIGRENWWFVAQ